MARVLVTGGAGFIGSHLVDRLVARGDEVVVVDDLSTGFEANLAASRSRVTFIRDRVENIAAHAAELGPLTHIVHLAAMISSHDSLKSPDLYLDANLKGLLRVLELSRHLGRPRVVFASSSTVYGVRTEPTCREQDLPAPFNVYALTKLAGEHLLAMYQDLLGYDFCVLRLFNVYGPRQNPNHAYANVTCKFAHAAAKGLPVTMYGDGHQTRDFVFVADVVSAFVRALEPTQSKLYNVGTGQDASIAMMLETVQRVSGTQLKVDRQPPWTNDIRAIRADVSRLRSEFRLPPLTELAVGLARTWEYFRS